MKNIKFLTETKEQLTSHDFAIIRQIYAPIIKKDACFLFETLFDFHSMNKQHKIYINQKDLLESSQMKLIEFTMAKKLLEAVGLMRTFESADESKIIFTLNKPLSASRFRQNKFLYGQFLKNSNELAFERFEFSNKDVVISKDEMNEVSSKFTDMFSVTFEKQTSTLEFEVPSNLKIDEALETLIPAKLIFYLAKRRAAPSELALVANLHNLGFSSPSINQLINYSFVINGKLVSKYVQVIANDMIKKDIKGAAEIKLELNNAKKSKTKVFFSHKPKTKKADENLDSWDEIFNSVGEF